MYRNISDALREELRTLLQEGDVVSVGGKEFKELRSRPIKISSPLDRVYINPSQINSIFAQIAETILVLSGRNDPKLLSYYVSDKIDSDREFINPRYHDRKFSKWLDLDTLKAVANVLKQDSDNNSVVIQIFDPSCDDLHNPNFPGTTSLYFTIRKGILHLNVSVSCSEIFDRFLGSDTFRWSVLHEMMAYWTGTQVGESAYFMSVLQLDRRHEFKAQQLVENFKDKTPYNFGFQSPNFSTNLETFDTRVLDWFSVEEKMRQGETEIARERDRFDDDLLRNSLEMLSIYNRYRQGAGAEEIGRLVDNLPSNDFKVAAIAYFSEQFNSRNWVNLQENERDYFDYLWGRKEAVDTYSFAAIFDWLSQLHYKKTLVYKNSWKKHGEALGVFAGISRKYDRLETIFTENIKPTADESILDTFADLAVYSTKYLTYIAEHYQSIFKDFIVQYSPIDSLENYWHNEGFDPVAKILIKRYEEWGEWREISSYRECYEAIKEKYKELEEIFVNGDCRVSDPRKCSLSADLAIVSVHYLVLASRKEPESIEKFATAIENL